MSGILPFNDLTPGSGQVDMGASPVRRILAPGNQTFLFQAVYGRRHRTAGQQDFTTNGVDRHRSPVLQHLHDRKITDFQAGTGDTGPVGFFKGLVRFSENQADVSSCVHGGK